MKYLHTKREHYKLFLEDNKTDRLSKFLKVTTLSKNYLKLYEASKGNFIKEEIFNKPIGTEYSLSDIDNYNNRKILFKSNSNTEYKLDILSINESG